MLRLPSISICAADTGSQVELHIQRTLRLKETIRRSNFNHNIPNDCPWGSREPYQGNFAGDDDRRANQESWSALRNDVDAWGREIRLLGLAGRQLASNFNEAEMRINSDITTLKAGLGILREALGKHSGDLSDLVADISSLRDVVKENQPPTGDISGIAALREQLASSESTIATMQQDFGNRLSSAEENLSQEMGSIRGELARAQRELQELKRQLGDHRSLPWGDAFVEGSYAQEVHLLRMEVAQWRDPTARDYARSQTSHSGASSREEFDILASSVAKFGNRVSQIETLQMESQLLKSRVQRLEANAAPVEGADL